MKKFELYFPVKPWFITQPFGVNGEYYRTNGINIKGHNGLDLRASDAQSVRATHDGEVVYAGVDSKEGWGVVLRTTETFGYNFEETYFKTIYWHLIKEIPVKVGQQIKAGDLIGYADNTGFSNFTHLHFGLKPQSKGENDWTWWNTEQDNGYGGAIDPMPYFNSYFAQDAQLVIGILSKIIELLKLSLTLFKK